MADDGGTEPNRPQMYLFGCSLTAERKEFHLEVEDEGTEHQLSLKSVCLGAEAEDKFHTVEIEGVTYDGKTSKVPLAVLKPSVLPSLSLAGFEITPPVSFRLHTGSGPVYISGQHFVSVKDWDEEEEENNTSPVKRPSNMTAAKLPPKKLKLDSEDDDDSENDSEDDDDDDDEGDDDDDDKGDGPAEKSHVKSPKKNKTPPGKKQDGAAQEPQAKSPGGRKDKAGTSSAPKVPSLGEIKSKLTAAVKQGSPLPKTEQKFENYARSSFKISDKQVVKDLWSFLQTLKPDKK
ncbi:nucleophosmin 1b isoform X2 [Denticeps clupeoides]|uniref:nucleophosmin 1b isoform X2 n=1 Tax=Denticeps clupeoides TaxID=299321 RepID=UPI0010A41CD1|nr:nucleophosmin-like isoform X2 [Denticeps clupeoides]